MKNHGEITNPFHTLPYRLLKHPDYSQNFSDQFGFRIYYCHAHSQLVLFQELTNMLQHHNYVHIISLEISKAFDTVRHHVLISIRKIPNARLLP